MAKNVTGVVLAAGAAKINDQPKLTLPIDGEPMIRIATSRLADSGVSRVIVVTGAQADAIGEALAGLDVTIVQNSAYASGVGSSIRAGVEAAPMDAEGLLFLPGDMPLVTAEHSRLLLERFAGATEGIVIPAYQKVPGFPQIYDRRHRQALISLRADEELFTILAEHPHDVADVHLVTDAVVFDVDDEDDYAALHRRLGLPVPEARTENVPAR